jgi:hypothetical protein
MKLEDMPTAIQTVVTDLAVLIEVNQKLAIAVAALRKIEDTDNYASDGGWDAGGMGPDEISRDAIAQIMEKE